MEKKIVRIALVALAILAIGILVLPSTVTLFAGQHTWYYKESLPCENAMQM
jgi:vancomycin permeability regulator SanA